jgi:hypothetical protein
MIWSHSSSASPSSTLTALSAAVLPMHGLDPEAREKLGFLPVARHKVDPLAEKLAQFGFALF